MHRAHYRQRSCKHAPMKLITCGDCCNGALDLELSQFVCSDLYTTPLGRMHNANAPRPRGVGDVNFTVLYCWKRVDDDEEENAFVLASRDDVGATEMYPDPIIFDVHNILPTNEPPPPLDFDEVDELTDTNRSTPWSI
jgi:hypothetical protein